MLVYHFLYNSLTFLLYGGNKQVDCICFPHTTQQVCSTQLMMWKKTHPTVVCVHRLHTFWRAISTSFYIFIFLFIGSRVFILSPRNPNEYTHIMPPPELQEHPGREDILTKYEEEVQKHKARMEGEIAEHQNKMVSFAAYLERRGITVTGVHQLNDMAVGNVIQWADRRIRRSDFVLLVITPSFSKFLDSPPPPEDEVIFGATGGYVSRLLHHSPEGVTFLCVFLDQPKNMDLLPITLRGQTLYEPLANPQEFKRFCALITKPPTGHSKSLMKTN